MDFSMESGSLKFEQVEEFVRKVLDKYQVSSKLHVKIMICVKEAVTNSIVHGNKFDAQKNVRIKILRCHNDLFITIRDEGEGFDFHNLPDPTLKENLLNETGRGLFLMKNLSDDIEFKDNGKIVQLKINLCSDDKILF